MSSTGLPMWGPGPFLARTDGADTPLFGELQLLGRELAAAATLFQVCCTYETVPCRALGMVLRYVDGRVFVTKVLPESQAEVDEVVLAGDILDEINGCSLRYACPGQAGAMLQRLKGQPLSFRLLRWRWHDGAVFEPLLPYLKALKEKEPHFQLQHSPRHRGEGEPQQLQGGRLLYNLQYLGQTSVGTVRLWGRDLPWGESSLLQFFSCVQGLFPPSHSISVWWQRGAGGSHPCRAGEGLGSAGQKHLCSQDGKGQ
ncbi:PREDICTED: uncharacterized protein LOC108448879 isoform X4 [Corvus brachyrhynchos]|uniref:uncharacterized protein LOC108448879 isoform X4 n=1 Tax=Corvus brachyrhynchos TaxID=85066 RepID=UPI000816501B|nr:PREDICTED: uncharacterized protein LOC108448879 isoform X4 [Corvus brachyrhynchos]